LQYFFVLSLQLCEFGLSAVELRPDLPQLSIFSRVLSIHLGQDSQKIRGPPQDFDPIHA
jgi:hypothetical protein